MQPAGYDNLMGWIVENRNLPVDGVPLGIKAAIGVGDCVNCADPVYGGEGLIAAKAWSRLDAAGIHKQMAPGNHDWVNGGGFGFARDDAHLDGVWTGNNPFSAKWAGFGARLRHVPGWLRATWRIGVDLTIPPAPTPTPR